MSTLHLPTLSHLTAAIAGCAACPLGSHRRAPVVYRGAERADLMFVGDVPAEAEDATGVAFSGPAGMLLDNMIRSIRFTPEEVHIAHIVKCHSPGARRPTKEELDACSGFIDAQIDIVKPRVIVSLGVVATQTLTGTTRFLEARGRWHVRRGVPVMPTHHPAHLLRSNDLKRGSWHDMQLVAAKLGRPVR